ncbi:MAG: bifunctional glutamate N-acetyltransferase/amino-acid acetyltransferase ArgJ [Candidatus Omnitrophota bacterium]|nr:bifunctional glutamate N-acetyltransferase/amino-acid acetyltransferase ArgJ [Candidatus Omnitrophota bacterium]
MKWVGGGVTAARGFLASGISAGIKPSRRPDLALVVSQGPASCAGVVTANRVKAAPVQMCLPRLARGYARAVVINSGCANCLTGNAGLNDARRVGHAVAKALKVADRDLLLASTGLIGTRLPVERIQRAIPRLVSSMRRSNHREAAWAILTTDRRPKEAAVKVSVGGRTFHVGGMAKGAGMIAPSMATMLGVITTDVAAPPRLLRGVLREAVEGTFNRISIDGDMSTNDTVLLLANGRSGVRLRAGSTLRVFAGALLAVADRLSRLIVADGEGASRVMDVRVMGARTAREAHLCARQVATSPLVKTMLSGGDANVGRIAAAVGASTARFDPSQLEIHIQRQRVVAGGQAVTISEAAVRTLLRRPEVLVRIDLHAGRAQDRMTTCDLTADYVRINAGYAT